ncbi:GNAT family N-acetyltransferase [soil metagenome]
MTRPTLHTDRLVLVPLTFAHTDLLVELDSDADVLRFITGRALSRAEVVDTWMPVRTRPEADARGLGYWVGYAGSPDPESFLGWWCLGTEGPDPDSPELGYRLRRTAWGSGYATEGSRALLAHAFTTVGVPRVWAQTMAVNTVSRRVMEKLGLRVTRTYVGEWGDPLPGWEQGEVEYEITADQWAEQAAAGQSLPAGVRSSG